MFSNRINKQEALITVNSLLTPYLFLDKTKSDGKDMRYKFANMGFGVSADHIQFLNELSQESQNWELTNEERLKIVDLLVLFANHLDQHVDATQNPKLETAVKENTVLNWLEKAFNLFKGSKPELQIDNARTLSSYAQLLHYRGKALRYNKTSIEDRLETLKEAVVISQYLDRMKLEEMKDPHQFIARTMTYELPIIYNLQDLNRLDEALEIAIKQEKDAPTQFHRIQAEVQIAQIYRKKQNPEMGITHAKTALDLAISEKSNLKFNAEQALMECFWEAGQRHEAVEIAHDILQPQNKNTGIKESHINAATGILQQTESASLRM